MIMFDNDISIGNSPIVKKKKIMNCVYELRPPVVRFKFLWDVNVVLDYLNFLSSFDSFELTGILIGCGNCNRF